MLGSEGNDTGKADNSTSRERTESVSNKKENRIKIKIKTY